MEPTLEQQHFATKVLEWLNRPNKPLFGEDTDYVLAVLIAERDAALEKKP